MTGASSPVRVLLVDDHDVVRAGFRVILESEPGIQVVAEAADGAAAVDRVLETQPDVVCMDVQMPGMDGVAATRAILASGSAARVLIVTTFDRDDYFFDALAAGASGFLLKNAPAERLIEAVKVLSAGDALLAPDVTRRVIERFAARPVRHGTAAPPHHGPAPQASSVDGLTAREHEVLAHLARGRSNSEIAAELHLGEATVKTHVSRVLAKVGVRDRIQLVVFAYEHGIATPLK